jgi:hypothetical protein
MGWLDSYHTDFSWSHSRAALWEECPRKYYWRYYAPYGGNAPWETTERALIYLLGRLSNIPMLVGSIIHEIARDALRSAQKGHLWSANTYSASAQVLLKRAMRASEKAASHPAGRLGKGTAILDAHYYHLPFGPAEEQAALERADLYAQGLYQHPTFQDALGHAADLLAVDRFDTFLVVGVPVYAVPDLVQSVGAGGLRLVDWKTGGSVEEHMESYTAQLAVYALYASRKWSLDAGQIDCQVAELHTGRTRQVQLDAAELKQAEGRIAASILLMQSRLRDLARNQAHRDDFPMLASPETPLENTPAACRWCSYRLPCYGARVLGRATL